MNTPAEKVEILRAACCVAGANQTTSESESVILSRLAKEIGVGRASLNAMIERSEQDHEFHKRQFEILKSEPTQTMAILFEVALADGTIDDSEVTVLTNLAKNLGVGEAIVLEMIARSSS